MDAISKISFCFRLKFYYTIQICKIHSISWLLAHAMNVFVVHLRGCTWVKWQDVDCRLPLLTYFLILGRMEEDESI